MEAQRPYQYRIGCNQSTKGVISFDGHVYFDDPLEATEKIHFLEGLIREAELYFKQKGHLIASEVTDDKPTKATK